MGARVVSVSCVWLWSLGQRTGNVDACMHPNETRTSAVHPTPNARTSQDADGNGMISLTEIMGLTGTVGLSKALLRARFRAKDMGNTGELSPAQAVEVLQELRDLARHQGSS